MPVARNGIESLGALHRTASALYSEIAGTHNRSPASANKQDATHL